MMPHPLDAEATSVPSIGRRQIVLVDGRTFAISDESGQMLGATHGMVHDDLRHLSIFALDVSEADADVLASSSPTPLSAVIVARLGRAEDSSVHAVMTRRRWVAGGLREDVHVHNTSPGPQRWSVRMRFGADFAHLFAVKAGEHGTAGTMSKDADGWRIVAADVDASTRIAVSPDPDDVDLLTGTFTWRFDVQPRTDHVIVVTVEPIVDDVAGTFAFPIGSTPADAIPMRRLASWEASVPRVISTDP